MKIPDYWKKDWFIGVTVALLFFIIGVSGNLRGLDWYAYDVGVSFTSSGVHNDQLVVVAIDDAAIQTLGSWPWPRDILADVTKIISSGKPGVIGYTVPFDTKQSNYGLDYIKDLKDAIEDASIHSRKIQRLLRNAENGLDTDRLFARSLNQAGPVVLSVPYDESERDFAFKGIAIDSHMKKFGIQPNNIPERESWIVRVFTDNPVPIVERIRPPIVELSQHVRAVGHINLGGNQASYARRDPLLIQYGDNYLPSFALMVATRYVGLEAKNIQVNFGTPLRIKGQGIDKPFIADEHYYVYPHFYKGRGEQAPFAVYSILDVLSGKISPSEFKGKAVLIGFTSQHEAKLITPIDDNMLPVIFNAHVISSLLNDDLYHVPSWGPWVKYLFLILVGLYLSLLLPRLRLTTGVSFTVVLVLVILNAHFILMISQSTWVPMMLPLLALIVGHVLLSFKHVIAERVGSIAGELSNANLLLGQSFHNQGQLDQAFERYRKCSTDETVLEYLYNLAQDYERKRQLNKAVSVFEFIQAHSSEYRDVNERIERTRQAAQKYAMNPGASNNMNQTLILDNTGVQKPMLGRYHIDSELGRGAMGMVYLGRDPKIGRTVAIKTMVLAQEFEGEKLAEVKERFFREAETAGRLNHPNIVTIYDVGEDEDLSYIAMDYLKGHNLLHFCQPDNLLKPKEAIECLVKCAEALEYAHQHSVVHRDVKPANIIYDEETKVLKVTDFGVACLTDSSKTKTGTILGSPSYMSPEQLAGMKVDGRSDLFSLGITMYQMLTGELPFIGESLASLMYKIANEKHPDVRLFRPELPSCVSRIINKALAKEADKRFQTGERFAQALVRCIDRL